MLSIISCIDVVSFIDAMLLCIEFMFGVGCELFGEAAGVFGF